MDQFLHICAIIGIVSGCTLGALLALSLLFILLLFVSSLFVDTSREYEVHSRYYRTILNMASGAMFVLLNIRVHVTGMDKVPQGTRFLLVSNHRSNFDPIITWYIFRKYDIAYISKEANFHIPIFGRLIRKCCFLSIDREDPRQSLKTLQKAADLAVRDQVSLGIYPEGTRSKECVLLPFHNGIFKAAQKADIPVITMTIQGTETIHKNTPFKRSHICLDVLDVMPAADLKGKRTSDIGDRVRELMENKLGN